MARYAAPARPWNCPWCSRLISIVPATALPEANGADDPYHSTLKCLPFFRPWHQPWRSQCEERLNPPPQLRSLSAERDRGPRCSSGIIIQIKPFHRAAIFLPLIKTSQKWSQLQNYMPTFLARRDCMRSSHLSVHERFKRIHSAHWQRSSNTSSKRPKSCGSIFFLLSAFSWLAAP